MIRLPSTSGEAAAYMIPKPGLSLFSDPIFALQVGKS